MSEYGLYIRFVSLSSAGQRRCCTASLNACGQFSSRRSGTRLANTTALQTGNGRRAHQRWSVEICPWRMLLSRTLSAEISLIGRATSISFFAFRYSSYSFVCLSLSSKRLGFIVQPGLNGHRSSNGTHSKLTSQTVQPRLNDKDGCGALAILTVP